MAEIRLGKTALVRATVKVCVDMYTLNGTRTPCFASKVSYYAKSTCKKRTCTLHTTVGKAGVAAHRLRCPVKACF